MHSSRLRALRSLSGATILDSAPIAGVSFTTLCHAERGIRKLTTVQIEKLETFYFERIKERLKLLRKLLSN